MTVLIRFSYDKNQYDRTVYSILDVFGDYGGVVEVFNGLVYFILSPISTHSYIGKAISLLYMARTKNDKLFHEKKSSKAEKKRIKANTLRNNISNDERRALEEQRQIKISLCQSLEVFFRYNLLCCFKRCRKKSQIEKLYDKGADMLEKEMDMVKLIKDLRNVKAYFKKHVIEKELSNLIKFSGKNVINNDSSE